MRRLKRGRLTPYSPVPPVAPVELNSLSLPELVAYWLVTLSIAPVELTPPVPAVPPPILSPLEAMEEFKPELPKAPSSTPRSLLDDSKRSLSPSRRSTPSVGRSLV